jgi:hypothetical protein
MGQEDLLGIFVGPTANSSLTLPFLCRRSFQRRGHSGRPNRADATSEWKHDLADGQPRPDIRSRLSTVIDKYEEPQHKIKITHLPFDVIEADLVVCIPVFFTTIMRILRRSFRLFFVVVFFCRYIISPSYQR